MPPTMDVDENDKAGKDDGAAGTESKAAAGKPKRKDVTPSASSESASVHPDMSLAQDIHRLTMVRDGRLSAADAEAIAGCAPEELLERVMTRVGTGGKTLEEAMSENEARIDAGEGDGGEKKKPKAGGDEKKDGDKRGKAEGGEDEPLLNPTLYRQLRSSLGYASPSALTDNDLKSLDEHHAAMLKRLDGAIERAREEAGDMEVLRAHVDGANYRARCCDAASALAAYEAVVNLPKLSAGKKLDARLDMARVQSFWGDRRGTRGTLEEAQRAAADGGDWDRRNRLRAYRALDLLLARDLEGAGKLFAEGIATFSCPELCGYPEFVMHAVVTSLLYAKRTELKKTIIDGSEVLQVAKEIPAVIRLANTLYDCDYKAYLHSLVDLQPHLVANRYLQPHAGYILRELHVLALRQFLDSYQSVTLDSMAASFGVSSDFLDVQLSRFIAAGRLTAKIDKYGGVVETNRPDWKNARYRETIQKGDLLLNRIQKLGRVVDL